VRYIHLNPLRAKLVDSLDQLGSYPYGGHSALMGKCSNEWQDVEEIPGRFGRRHTFRTRALIKVMPPLCRMPHGQ